MADLSDKDASQTVKITGASSTGTESSYVQATSAGGIHSNLRDSSGTEITSSSNGEAGNQLLHVQTPDTTTSSTALGALNATIQVAMTGLGGAGFQLAAGTFRGTLIPESSIDGGTSWVASSFIDPASNNTAPNYSFTSNNTLLILSIVPVNGASHVRVRVSAYTSGTANAILRVSATRGPGQSVSVTQVVSSLPAATVTKNSQINTGLTTYTTYTATQKIAIKQFYAAGSGVGQQKLFYYSPSTTQYVNAGDFETAGDINTTWLWTSVGGTGSIASSTAQFFTGARSVQLTFSNSSGNNAQGVKQTFSSPIDVSTWRYISAQFYNTVSAGGAYTRTISIVLTDSSANTLKYDLSGLSTASPFNASGWIKLTGEILNPTSTTGTGFDLSQVVSIELRMNDSANKSGVVYWDTVQFESQMTLILPIFHSANQSINVLIDPVAVLNSGSQIIISQTNSDSTRKEYFALVGGVAIS